LPDRKWPDNTITKAPIWCSVDLRDGNQALINPMDMNKKLELFALLLKIGFKEIEVGFPSASKIEFDFLRKLVDDNLIPDDVTIQVLVQAREHLIAKTFEALAGVKKATVHLYNSTSVAQRKIVFGKSQDEIIDRLYNVLKMRDQRYLVALDDSDDLIRRDGGKIIELLTRIEEEYGERLIYPIIIVRNMAPIYSLSNHIRSKIDGPKIEFKPYNWRELIDIIEERIIDRYR